MNLRRLLQITLGTCLLIGSARAQNLEPATGAKPAPKPVDRSLVEIEDTPGLPRVLLIGDSISMGYTLSVREKLKGRANVHRILENGGDTARGLLRLDAWLGSGHWDVIHFNFGLHDLKYLDEKGKYVSPDKGKQVASTEVYGKQLREITQRLQKTGAAIIFATTTPVPPGTQGRVGGDDRKYNEVAVAIMKELNVPVDDLGGYVQAQQAKVPPRPESELPKNHERVELRPGEIQSPFNVHFTAQGYDQLATLVVTSIEQKLPGAKTAQ